MMDLLFNADQDVFSKLAYICILWTSSFIKKIYHLLIAFYPQLEIQHATQLYQLQLHFTGVARILCWGGPENRGEGNGKGVSPSPAD